jgi:hypothetical protein
MKVKTHLKAGQLQVLGDLNVTQTNGSAVTVSQTSTSTIGGA